MQQQIHKVIKHKHIKIHIVIKDNTIYNKFNDHSCTVCIQSAL